MVRSNDIHPPATEPLVSVHLQLDHLIQWEHKVYLVHLDQQVQLDHQDLRLPVAQLDHLGLREPLAQVKDLLGYLDHLETNRATWRAWRTWKFQDHLAPQVN